MKLTSHRTSYEEVWVALNLRLSLPTPKTHPDFPLWKLGFSPQDVYDAFFPRDFRFLGNPDRPAVCGRFGLESDRLWRFEFVVREDEDGDTMAKPRRVSEILTPYLTHDGRRYGYTIEDPCDILYRMLILLSVSGKIVFPEDCIDTLRSRPYRFIARSCNIWALGRVVLCGDAAHVFPPCRFLSFKIWKTELFLGFACRNTLSLRRTDHSLSTVGGQGIVSGFRDAASLSWRLAVACRPEFSAYENLLTAWYTERKQQLELSLAATIENGNYVTNRNPFRILMRDWSLWLMRKIPSWDRRLQRGARREGMARYHYRPGMAFLPQYLGGRSFPQVYCSPLSRPAIAHEDGVPIMFTDDVVFASDKTGLFQLAVLLDSAAEVPAAREAIKNVDRLSRSQILAHEASYIIHDLELTAKADPFDSHEVPRAYLVRIASGEEFAESPLCANRPEPLRYDARQLKQDMHGRRYIIVRPDRFVYAACETNEEVEDAASMLIDVLDGGKDALCKL